MDAQRVEGQLKAATCGDKPQWLMTLPTKGIWQEASWKLKCATIASCPQGACELKPRERRPRNMAPAHPEADEPAAS